MRVQPANTREVWDSFRGGWLGAFGPLKCIQMDEGGEWKNEIWTDLLAARPWSLERRDGLARGSYNRLFEDDRFPSEQILSKVQW